MFPENVLYVRAARGDRTYVGGAFCPEEPKMREQFESLSPDQAFAVNAVKSAVQRGEYDMSEAMDRLGNHVAFADIAAFTPGAKTSARHRAFVDSLRGCLSRINEKQCLAYPALGPSEGTTNQTS